MGSHWLNALLQYISALISLSYTSLTLNLLKKAHEHPCRQDRFRQCGKCE